MWCGMMSDLVLYGVTGCHLGGSMVMPMVRCDMMLCDVMIFDESLCDEVRCGDV